MNTYISFLLDKSGSMGHVQNATIEAFNAYLDGVKGLPDCRFSLIQFDSVSLEKTCANVPVGEAPKLSVENYTPRGATPLLDAVMKTILATEKLVGDDTSAKVIISIQTDGLENASRQFGWDAVNDKIKEMTAKGWQFDFLGVGLDAYHQGSRMGVSAGQTMSYDPQDFAATRSAFSAKSAATMRYASGQSLDTSFTNEERLAAKDVGIDAIKAQPGSGGAHSGGKLPNIGAGGYVPTTVTGGPISMPPMNPPDLGLSLRPDTPVKPARKPIVDDLDLSA